MPAFDSVEDDGLLFGIGTVLRDALGASLKISRKAGDITFRRPFIQPFEEGRRKGGVLTFNPIRSVFARLSRINHYQMIAVQAAAMPIG